VFTTTLKVVYEYGMYDVLSPQLKNIERWVREWGSLASEIRELYLYIAGIAEKAGDDEYVLQFSFSFRKKKSPDIL
jgi:translation initiation factor 3 subunit M